MGRPDNASPAAMASVDTRSFSNECVLESWNELIVANELDRNGIKWLRPGKFILSSGKFYEPDFYLSDYNVYLDPKSKFFGKRVYQGYSPYVDQTEKIKMFEIEYKIPCLILWSHEKNSFFYHKPDTTDFRAKIFTKPHR